MKLKLDKEDQEMLESFENGKWVRVANPEAASAVCPQHPVPLEHFPASRVKKHPVFSPILPRPRQSSDPTGQKKIDLLERLLGAGG